MEAKTIFLRPFNNFLTHLKYIFTLRVPSTISFLFRIRDKIFMDRDVTYFIITLADCFLTGLAKFILFFKPWFGYVF